MRRRRTLAQLRAEAREVSREIYRMSYEAGAAAAPQLLIKVGMLCGLVSCIDEMYLEPLQRMMDGPDA